MPKSTKAKLAVDGTAKLAARSKPGDKHEKANLSIEEATIASPRPSRKRAGEFFDFEPDTKVGDATASNLDTEGKPDKAVKRAKTSKQNKPRSKAVLGEETSTDKTKEPEVVVKVSEKGSKNAKSTPTGTVDAATTDAEPKKSKERKEKATTKPKPSSTEAKKDIQEGADSKNDAEKLGVLQDSKPTKTKAKSKSKATAKESSKPADENAESTSQAAGESGEGKAGSEATNPQVKASALKGASDSGEFKSTDSKKSTSKTSKPKKEARGSAKEAPTKEPAKKEKETGGRKAPKTKKSADNAPDIPDQAVKPDDLVRMNSNIVEPSKSEGPKSKKRKAPETDAAAKLQNVESPSEPDSETAKKKQKASRKSLGESVGALLASSFDAASGAVRSSLGGLGFGGGADGKINTTSQEIIDQDQAADASLAQPANHEASDDSEAEPDDQTAAILAGFESDGDEAIAESPDSSREGVKVPSLPRDKQLTKRLKEVQASKADNTKTGVVYIGRIPHGFYEHEMRDYFSQFGDITRLRLSRSRKTGHSKHYAFVEFANEDVAAIVAETMDNYLMFGRILKCKVVPAGDVHEGLWKGSNKRFKSIPWNKIEGRKLALPASRSQWKKREAREGARRATKAQKMQEKMGYSLEGHGLKSVDDIPVKTTSNASPIDAGTEREETLVTVAEAADKNTGATVVITKEIKTKKSSGKKSSKSQTSKVTVED